MKPTISSGLNKAELAEAVARWMFERDTASRAMGMEILESAPGYSKVRMTVRADMLNGHGTTHGGITYTLADSAFAFACNSHNLQTVAAQCSITYTAPAREGDILTAEARRQFLKGRSGLYDVTVTNQHGETIALFRGNARQVGDTLIPEPGTL